MRARAARTVRRGATTRHQHEQAERAGIMMNARIAARCRNLLKNHMGFTPTCSRVRFGGSAFHAYCVRVVAASHGPMGGWGPRFYF